MNTFLIVPRYKIVLIALLLIGILVGVHWTSRRAGYEKAKMDKSDQSTLPAITFTYRKRSYVGKLLYLKGEVYFVDSVRAVGEESGPQLQLFVYKGSDLEDIRITEHQ